MTVPGRRIDRLFKQHSSPNEEKQGGNRCSLVCPENPQDTIGETSSPVNPASAERGVENDRPYAV